MPHYRVDIITPAVLTREELDYLESDVYNALTNIDEASVGKTEIEAKFD